MSTLITANNLNYLQTKAVHKLTHINDLFAASGLTFNLHKTNVLHFKSTYLLKWHISNYLSRERS